ncbi:hypothetical protein [Mycolicibacterium phlei]|uniref:hypothetical protein n=1 Tax=Mycolicibacterium phlei TaxID=1771 RepID=UPI0037CAC7A8
MDILPECLRYARQLDHETTRYRASEVFQTANLSRWREAANKFNIAQFVAERRSSDHFCCTFE